MDYREGIRTTEINHDAAWDTSEIVNVFLHVRAVHLLSALCTASIMRLQMGHNELYNLCIISDRDQQISESDLRLELQTQITVFACLFQ